MKTQTRFQKFSTLMAMGLAALVLSSGAFAQHGGGGGGGGGGGHGGGFSGGHAGGFSGGHAGGYAGGYHGGGYGGYHGGGYGGYRGGYYGGYRGGYYGGWHGGYYGWRGGWYGGWGGCWGCWGWGVGLGLGLYFATLPYYYTTYYWGGVPYYYADNTYYTWDPNANQYLTVAPPAGLQTQVAGSAPAGAGPSAAGTSAGTDLIAYPKNGQSTDQQAKDKFDCHQWAVGQSGFDPSLGTSTAPSKRNDYMRAQAACLEGRGYSVQ